MNNQIIQQITASPKKHTWIMGFHEKRKTAGIHLALYTLLETAIEEGKLRAGDKLPPHRKLAQELAIAVATVTKVYKAAECNGLIYAKTGKGSFVSTVPVTQQSILARDAKFINLSIIKPVTKLAEPYLQRHMKSLSEQQQLSELMEYNPEGGSDIDRKTAALWLTKQGVSLEGRELSICSGAQHGLMILINTLTEVGDNIAVEAYCYPGIIALANQLGRHLIPLELDKEGMIPKVLEEQCARYDVKLVIAVASHQNPTTTIMSSSRRKAIAKIITQQSLWLIDDDVYGFLCPEIPVLSSFVPERSFYLTSLSKALLPGLRIGYLSYPKAFKQRIDAAIRNTIWMPVPIALALAAKFIYSGDADTIIEQQKATAMARQKIARQIFKDFSFSAEKNGYHIWLSLPYGWSSESFCKAAKRQGVLVSNAESFYTSNGAVQAAVRLSLMSAKSDDELRFGLNLIKQLLIKNE